MFDGYVISDDVISNLFFISDKNHSKDIDDASKDEEEDRSRVLWMELLIEELMTSLNLKKAVITS